jgi:hypothetical protein
MRLDPLRETSIQPAPKSRLAVSGLYVFEDQKQKQKQKQKQRATAIARATGNGNSKSDGFPAEASPTVEVCRESQCTHALLQVGLALAGKRPTQAPSISRRSYRRFPG